MAGPRKKKKRIKVDPDGIGFIKASFNNTIVTLTDKFGNAISWCSSGSLGFKGSRKNTAYAASIAAEKVATGYIMNRRCGVGTTSGYISLENQLDQLYHDMKDGKLGVAATTGSWYVGITSVKTAFPKPS